MFTRNIKDTFTQGLLNAVSGVLGEAKKKCSEGCECDACVPEEDTNEGYVSNAQRKAVWANRADDGKGHPDKKMKKEGYMPTNDAPSDKDRKTAGKLGAMLKRERESKEKKEPNGVKTEETDDDGYYAHKEIHGSKGISKEDWKKGVRMNSKGQRVMAKEDVEQINEEPTDPNYHAKVHQDLQWHASRNKGSHMGAANYNYLASLKNQSHVENHYEKTVLPILKKHGYPAPPEGPGASGNQKYHDAIQETIKKWKNERRVSDVKESTKDLDEGLMHNRYMRSHGKKARGTGSWAFTTKEYGSPKENEMHFTSGHKSLSDAHKEAATKLGTKHLYVMEEVELDDVPFKGPYRKAGERKDEYGNKVKNVAKYLAKKAMNAQKNEEVELDESEHRFASEKSKFDSGHRAKLLNPEGRMSYLSQKSYKTAKHAKEAAKFYHSVSHLPIQTIDNKMSQYNKAYDAKHKMAEEVEDLDEKRGLWDNIHAKRKRIKAGSGERMRKPGSKGAPSAADLKASQTEEVSVDEAFEQINELSKATMGRYINKAADRMSTQGVTAGLKIAADEKSKKNFDNIAKRQKGIATAVKKLTKEEQDFIDALNDADMEQIDELSKDTMLKYLSANKKDDAKAKETGNYDKMTKRMRGTDMAVRKYTAKPGSKYVRVPATEEVELDEARGRPKKAGAKDFTVHPKTKQKLMHNDPEDMKKIEALQRNGVIPVQKIEANQHVMQQLQRAKLSMRGGETVNFTHGDSHHVSGEHAAKLLTKYAGMKPNEKEAFQKKIGHSHANLKSEL